MWCKRSHLKFWSICDIQKSSQAIPMILPKSEAEETARNAKEILPKLMMDFSCSPGCDPSLYVHKQNEWVLTSPCWSGVNRWRGLEHPPEIYRFIDSNSSKKLHSGKLT